MPFFQIILQPYESIKVWLLAINAAWKYVYRRGRYDTGFSCAIVGCGSPNIRGTIVLFIKKRAEKLGKKKQTSKTNKQASSEKRKWYQNAVIYALDIGVFKDSNGDGVGDFKGATQKLDYLAHLGISCIWLLPFYYSPERDNGYDVMAHELINSKFGTTDDFIEFLQECEKRSIRVILDLIANHTSDEHPWFKAACYDKSSVYHDYYMWRKEPPEEKEENVFKEVESGTWKFSERAKEYYYHKYYHFEPKLNFNNPRVRNEIKDVMEYWMSFGISGFRIDAATHIFDYFDNTTPPSKGEVMEEFNDHVRKLHKDAVLLAEADVVPKEIPLYTGDGGRMNMLFNFLVNNSLFLALARQSAEPLVKRLKTLPQLPDNAQWVNFVRNLDELDLERLEEDERKEVFRAFAPNPIMRVYGRGIRRRTASMLQGNFAAVKMVYNILFALPGTPMIPYGDEIGMGDNLLYDGRTCVRTPMQWKNSANGGFSEADRAEMEIKPIDYDVLGYNFVNVEDQLADNDSLLMAIRKFIDVRKNNEVIGYKRPQMLEVEDHEVLALTYKNNSDELHIYINLGPENKFLEVEVNYSDDFEPVLEDSPYGLKKNDNTLSLRGYGYRWFKRK